MGIIHAAVSAAGGAFADQWLEVIEADAMDNKTLLTKGVPVATGSKRGSNRKGSPGVITDGSVIHVAENQFMILTDGGKIIDYSAEPGYYVVQNQAAPSLFNGHFDAALEDAYARLRFGGVTPVKQQVFFINLQEIRENPFGTPAPLNYFDQFYNAELFLRANGYYSVRVTNPLKFYAEMGSRSGDRVTVLDFQKSCLAEFLTAFQTSITKMSAEGVRISHIGAKSMELAKVMSTVLDEDWNERRGMMIVSVGINAISYDENSKKLIEMRNQGAMLTDPAVREGYVQGAMARGVEAAGSNAGGAAAAFMGMNMGASAAGSFVQATGDNNRQVKQQQEQPDANSWQCACGNTAIGKFCSECGTKKPAAILFCPDCGEKVKEGAKFCAECGSKLG